MKFKFFISNAFVNPEKAAQFSGNPAAVVILNNDVSFHLLSLFMFN